MLLGFKTELKLNNYQRTQLAKHVGTARHAYNWGLGLCLGILDHNRLHPDKKIKFPTAIDLHKWLVAIVKPENSWYYEVSKCAPQYALKALREGFAKWFSKKGGRPKFKKKGRDDSFTLDGTIKVLEQKKIQLPVIGILQTYEKLPIGHCPKNITISRQADRWFISWRIEVSTYVKEKNMDVVGVDLGVKSLATLSTGEVVNGSKSYRKYRQKLARLQRRLSRKVKHSSNWYSAVIDVAKLHRKIANIRGDTLHKLTTYLSKNHATVVIEDLNVSGMLANHKLAASVADMGFYEFRRQLEYKCKLNGSSLIIADRFFASSKTCSNCGHIKQELSLSERVFVCEQCSCQIDRDLNAAINLSRLSSNRIHACEQSAADGSG
ncbi:IS200/IS605 family element transposase accessory protein TnpB [Scytonema tolypothrichoides VB-61278]|nr:IS200/IS605 family element transposase accessory protein TnpB [Scytonema tolypothrichoides VB-61278]KAB8331574.1 IS200/IS605 family element transposase accessory protein TnpB [Scytonema tolypothrichoides VB-61278]KAB8331809.1 IS200/IS605 family element transposase accessory protein TnpB [Scytonema tolypothrichoides VB-61278]KAB8332150.1 IS200/IS605 family element transposase accessory protein TnpB [Scytonema tolypothrichoides VB-61278]KAB8334683.1 IS200/IS605 family element transposase acces